MILIAALHLSRQREDLAGDSQGTFPGTKCFRPTSFPKFSTLSSRWPSNTASLWVFSMPSTLASLLVHLPPPISIHHTCLRCQPCFGGRAAQPAAPGQHQGMYLVPGQGLGHPWAKNPGCRGRARESTRAVQCHSALHSVHEQQLPTKCMQCHDLFCCVWLVLD